MLVISGVVSSVITPIITPAIKLKNAGFDYNEILTILILGSLFALVIWVIKTNSKVFTKATEDHKSNIQDILKESKDSTCKIVEEHKQSNILLSKGMEKITDSLVNLRVEISGKIKK